MSDIGFAVDEIWYPPANILYHGDKKLRTQIKADVKRQVNEGMSAAVMLVGMAKMTGYEYRLQPVNQKEQTPDVRTMRIVETPGEPNWMEVQEVEVVTLEKNSTEQVDNFLKRTKLSSKKAYPPKMVILCHINKNLRNGKSWRDIHQSLKHLGIPNQVYILARIDPLEHKYQLVEVNPNLGLVEYDVQQELYSKPRQKILKMERGATPYLRPNGETHIPFEDL